MRQLLNHRLRELRLFEIEIIKQRLKLEGIRQEVSREAQMDAGYLVQCDVDRFFGIEYEEFPHRYQHEV